MKPQTLCRILQVLSIGVCGRVYAAFYPECRNIYNSKKFVASFTSCSRYIYCDGKDSFQGECLDDNLFNIDQGKCLDPNEVECKLKVQTTFSANIVNNGNLNPFQIGSLDIFAGWLQPSGANQAFKEALGLNPFYSILQTAAPDLSFEDFLYETRPPECPISFGQRNIINLPNPDSCSSYYTCFNGIAISMICGRGLSFNPKTSKCEPQSQFQCAIRRPTALQCRKNGKEFIPHPRNCEYYYLCINGDPIIMHCPFNYTWDYQKVSCVHHTQSKCFSSLLVHPELRQL